MESKVFRWLCVNVFEMLVLLSGVSAFLFLKVQLEHYMQNWPLKVSSGVLLSAAHVSVHHFSSCCVSLALNLRELCSFFFALFPLSLPVLAYCLAHRWPVQYLCDISVISLCYLCAIYAILRSDWCLPCAISVLSLCYLCYLMLSLCYLFAISLISLEYFSQICGLYTD